MPSRWIKTYFPEIWKFIYTIFRIFICSKIMDSDLKWVHMALYELILKLVRAIWLRIIFGNPQKPRARSMGERRALGPRAQINSYLKP